MWELGGAPRENQLGLLDEGAVVNGLGAVEGTLFASKALANDACFGIDPHLGRGGHEAMMIMMSIVGGGSSSS